MGGSTPTGDATLHHTEPHDADAHLSNADVPSVLIALVLYRVRAEQSVSWQSLHAALDASPGLKRHFRVLVYDHSPEPDPAATGFASDRTVYRHDPRNLGLAEAYNYALAMAAGQGCRWLLLLDQDTRLTADYLREAVAASTALAEDARVAAIVPKLRSPLGIKSPTLDFLDWLRRQFRLERRPLFASEETYGLQSEQWSAFNSASLLRVEALERIGGFDPDFPLDFLDTQTFFALHHAGGRLFVLHAALEHALSMDDTAFYTNEGSPARHRSVIAATVRFVKRNGTAADRRLHRFWLVRNAWTLLRRSHGLRFAGISLVAALRYR